MFRHFLTSNSVLLNSNSVFQNTVPTNTVALPLLNTGRTKLKAIIKNALASDFFSPLSRPLRGTASILCYHRITEKRFSRGGFNPNIYLCVREDHFEQQIRYLASKKKIASLNQIANNIVNSTNNPHKVGISFDDGYRDNLELALPILEKYNVPATIFISSGLIDKVAALWWEELGFIVSNCNKIAFNWKDKHYTFEIEASEAKVKAYLEINCLFKHLSIIEQSELLEKLRPQCALKFEQGNLLLSWDELKKLSKHPLITLGSHTLRHPILSNETEQDAFNEILSGHNILSEKVDQNTDLFAYPVGGKDEASNREFSLASKIGIKAAFTTRTGHIFKEHRSSMFSLPRITLDYFDDLNDFKWKLSGFTSLIKNKGKLVVTD